MASFSQINKQITEQKTEQITDALLLPQVLNATIETIINKALLLNTNKHINQNALESLDQTTLTVNLVELSFPVSLTINAPDHKNPIIVGTMIESAVIENSVIESSVLKSSLIESNHCTISTSLKTLKKIKENLNKISDWIRLFIKKIDMNLVAGPYSTYVNEK